MPLPDIERRLDRIEQLLKQRWLLQQSFRLLQIVIIPVLLGYLAYAVNNASNRIAVAQLSQTERFAAMQLSHSERVAEKQIELEYTKIYFENIFSANDVKTKRALDLLIALAKTSPGGARVAESLVEFVRNDTTQSAEIRQQATTIAEEIQTYTIAKRIARSTIYSDRSLTFYCSCPFESVGASSNAIDTSECDLGSSDDIRAGRMEWEHIVPVSYFGSSLACWQGEGCENVTGRRCCDEVNARFQTFAGDLHNIVPAVGVINAARGSLSYGEIRGESRRFGDCDIEINAESRLVEPPPHIRGDVARIWLFMRDVYRIPDPYSGYEAMLREWHKSDPVDEWERERNRRIAAIQGRLNHWVTD